MKGFIEIESKNGYTYLINIKQIIYVTRHYNGVGCTIQLVDSGAYDDMSSEYYEFKTNQLYEEVKRLIEEASK